METFKKYLPWIIGAIVVLYILRKMTTRTALLPQTQITQTPQVDPFAESRANAFEQLVGLGIAQTQADIARTQADVEARSIATAANLEAKRISSAFDLESMRIASGETVSLSSLDISRYIANLNFLQRDQDRQLQENAVNRYYSSRNTGNIVGSITQTLGQLLGNRQGGTVFGTPPTFPRFGGFF